jgi:signal transduction histidine kinase/CheY-like chemotaxis protein
VIRITGNTAGDWLADLAAVLPQTAWTARVDGTLEHVTTRWTELTGAEKEDAPADPSWFAAVDPGNRERARSDWQKAVRAGEAFHLEVGVVNRRTGTEHPVSAVAIPLRDGEDGTPRWLGLLSDRARYADASRRKDEFLAVLAHELRNPLAPIRNWVTVLRDGSLEGARQQEVWQVIDRQLDRLTRLVDDLFDATRISEGKLRIRKERFELRPALAGAVQAVEHELESKGHRLHVELPTERLQIDADPARFDQILINLLGNAARYTDNGGNISLIAERDERDLVLRVADDGIGIPAEMLSNIFEPYTQIDASWRRHHGGLGIGLAVVRSLVAMHGGTVEARSDGPGRGSEFTVRMPVVEGPVPTEVRGIGARQRGATVSTSRRILVVDDNEDSAVSLAILLKARGHDVHVAHDGPTAIERACDLRPDVVLLDLGLPGMDGCEVARRLRDRSETQLALLVAVTGYGHDEARERARRSGFDHHLVKPVVLRDLLAVISLR